MDRLVKTLLSTIGLGLLWSSATPSLTADTASMTLSGHAGRVWSVAYSPDGKTLASGGGGKVGEIKLWDLASGQARPISFIGHTAEVSFVVFSPDGKTLASGSNDRTIRLWEAATGKAKRSFPADLVTSLAFSPDGQTLASGCYDWTVQLWDVATGREKSRLQARHAESTHRHVRGIQPGWQDVGVERLPPDQVVGCRDRHGTSHPWGRYGRDRCYRLAGF